MAAGKSEGDALLELLGLGIDEGPVQASLQQLARGMQPELDPEDEDVLTDWVTVNEIGLEYGFQDEAYVRAWDPKLRRRCRLLLTQVYFYGDTPKTRQFPYSLPFGLTFADDRGSARRKMEYLNGKCRSYTRDSWRLPKFDVTIAYRLDTGRLESIYCHVRYAPWPPAPELTEVAARFPPELFIDLFGLRWSSDRLRTSLAELSYLKALPEIRGEHTADLLLTFGIELVFAPGSKIATADQSFARSLAFAAVTFYASRELDARQWGGSLPFDLKFEDSQSDLRRKVPGAPSEITDEDRSGVAVWHFTPFTLSVIYSNIENRVLRVTLLAPGFWNADSEGDDT